MLGLRRLNFTPLNFRLIFLPLVGFADFIVIFLSLFWPARISQRAAFVPHSRATACQGELLSGRLVVFITPLQRKKIRSVSGKIAIPRSRKNGAGLPSGRFGFGYPAWGHAGSRVFVLTDAAWEHAGSIRTSDREWSHYKANLPDPSRVPRDRHSAPRNATSENNSR
jgi:hypothetical protein